MPPAIGPIEAMEYRSLDAMRRRFRRPGRAGAGGFSLPEVLTIIALVGVLTAMALFAFSGTFDAAEEAVVRENVERLNNAVWTYSQVAEEIPIAPENSATADEDAVLALLRQTDPVDLPGSPYFSGGQSFVGSSDAEVYRARWNGRIFVVLVPGQAGSGLRVSDG